MSGYPIRDISGGWGYSHGVETVGTGQEISNNNPRNTGLPPVPLNGFSYVGAMPLSQPRRHFPNATPVLGNYSGRSSESEIPLDPYISKFSPTTQWQMAGKSLDTYASPEDGSHKQHYDPETNSTRQLMELPDPQMQVQLCDKVLWDQFSKAGTEMIVTKTGRRMFPGYRIKISGLGKDAKYCVMMDIVNVDDHRYKFQHGEWTIAGRGEPHLPQRFFLHPDSPATGAKWMSEIVSFHKVKLTNSVGRDVDGKIVLNSMHRYQPRIHIARTNDASTVHMQRLCTFAFPQTVFTTVTAYQNPEVTKLKIDNNPFAKGFREDGARAKKPRPPPNEYPDYDHIQYPDNKRHTFERGYPSTSMQRSPVAGPSYSRFGFDHGASPELPHSYPQIQRQHVGNYRSDTPRTGPYIFSDAGRFNTWSPNISTVRYQTRQSQATQLSYANYAPINVNQPYYSTPSSSKQQHANPDTVAEIETRQPENLDDVMENAEHGGTPSVSRHIPTTKPTVVSSKDSGLGSSPSALSEDDNTAVPSTAGDVGENLKSAEKHIQRNSLQSTTAIQVLEDASNDDGISPDSLNKVENPKEQTKSAASNTQATSAESICNHNAVPIIETDYPTQISVKNKNPCSNPEATFSFGSEAFHQTFAGEPRESEADAINWDTGMVKM